MNMPERISLPIDACLALVKEKLSSANTLIIKATPGSGKTTRVPPALMNCIPPGLQIIVLEPRRLAARLAAQRVAFECGEPCGKTIGYHIRFEHEATAATRVLFMTEGMLLRYLISDPKLSRAGAVILDEFHERHMHTDVALAAVRQLQAGLRPDLKLVVMSATLDVEKLAEALGHPPVVTTAAENYPLTVIHEASATQSESVEMFSGRIYERITAAISRGRKALATMGVVPGHVLIFLPGAPEIDRCAERITGIAEFSGDIICKLHGSLPAPDQRKVFEVSRRSKIILATNIAESSLTIEGVNLVVDAGLAKIPSFSNWAGLPTLKLQRVSQASCIQRAGRAARRGPGVVVRLYSEFDFRSRVAFEIPEIMRLDLSQTLLEVACVVDVPGPKPVLNIVRDLPWVDPPEAVRFAGSATLLRALGALDQAGHLTEIGREMAKYPLHPRLARIVHEGKRLKALGAAVTFAARVSEGAQAGRASAFAQIARIAGEKNLEPVDLTAAGKEAGLITKLILAGLADRVGRLEPSSGDATYRLVDGRTVSLKTYEKKYQKKSEHKSEQKSLAKSAAKSEWICLIDADVSATDPSRIQARDWMPIEMSADFSELQAVESLWKQSHEVDWDIGQSGAGGRVRGFIRSRFGALVLREASAPVDPELGEARLREELRKAWPRPFESDNDLQRWQQRLLVYSDAMKEKLLLDFSGGDFEFLLDSMAEGKMSFAEVTQRTINAYVEGLLGYADAAKINAACPDQLKLASGRLALVQYRAGQPPWVEGKMQEFFGTRDLPRLVNDRVPMVVHLLAPNNRPVQVTSDLAGFWKNHYQILRRELSRDYPRHFWPDDPMTAEAKIHLKQRRNV